MNLIAVALAWTFVVPAGPLLESARLAGEAASFEVFQERTRSECRADCEREFQQCQSGRRAGEHTMDCDAIKSACLDVCSAPRTRVEKSSVGRGTGIMLTLVAVAAGLIWAYLDSGQSGDDSDYQ